MVYGFGEHHTEQGFLLNKLLITMSSRRSYGVLIQRKDQSSRSFVYVPNTLPTVGVMYVNIHGVGSNNLPDPIDLSIDEEYRMMNQFFNCEEEIDNLKVSSLQIADISAEESDADAENRMMNKLFYSGVFTYEPHTSHPRNTQGTEDDFDEFQMTMKPVFDEDSSYSGENPSASTM